MNGKIEQPRSCPRCLVDKGLVGTVKLDVGTGAGICKHCGTEVFFSGTSADAVASAAGADPESQERRDVLKWVVTAAIAAGVSALADLVDTLGYLAEDERQWMGGQDAITSLSFGKRTYQGGHHPDNLRAGRALLSALNVAGQEIRPCEDDLELDYASSIVLIGGPTSTPLTGIVFEFDGDGDHQRRPEERGQRAFLPLQYWGMSDIDQVEKRLVTWIAHGKRRWLSRRWGIVRPRTKDPLLPSVSSETIDVDGKTANQLLDNYLLLTRIPNYLSQVVPERREQSPREWPALVIIDGSNGVGTRGLELLMRKDVLLPAINEARSSAAFQILFRVNDIRYSEEDGCDSAHGADVLDIATLPEDVDYRWLYAVAKRRMPQLTEVERRFSRM